MLVNTLTLPSRMIPFCVLILNSRKSFRPATKPSSGDVVILPNITPHIRMVSEAIIGIYSNHPLFGMVMTASEGYRKINVSVFVVVPVLRTQIITSITGVS